MPDGLNIQQVHVVLLDMSWLVVVLLHRHIHVPRLFPGRQRALPHARISSWRPDFASCDFGARSTVDQCARAAAQRGFDVFGLEVDGACFMGPLFDVPQMTQKLNDATCSNIPCLAGAPCVSWAIQVFSVGGSSIYSDFPRL
jgi:hypothetical protein